MREMRVHVAILLGLAAIVLFGFTIISNNSVTTWIAGAKYNVENGTQVLLAESAEESVAAIKRSFGRRKAFQDMWQTTAWSR